MPRLYNLEEIDSVENPKHKLVLQAIRDTDLTLCRIAERLEMTAGAVYYIANTYLPRGYLKTRAATNQMKALEDIAQRRKYQANDPVQIISAQQESDMNTSSLEVPDVVLPSGAQSEQTTQLKEVPRQEEVENIRSLERTTTDDYSPHFTIEYGGVKLTWHYGNDRFDPYLVGIMKKVKDIFGQ